MPRRNARDTAKWPPAPPSGGYAGLTAATKRQEEALAKAMAERNGAQIVGPIFENKAAAKHFIEKLKGNSHE